MREMESVNDRVRWFDLTGSPRVGKTKNRAHMEQERHDTKLLKICRKKRPDGF